MSPAEHAQVLCCDEKIQVQVLDRTQPGPHIKRGHHRAVAQKLTYELVRIATSVRLAFDEYVAQHNLTPSRSFE